MTNVIVKVENADACDAIHIYIDNIPYGRKLGNSTFEIPVQPGTHVIYGIYDNVEDDFAGISHQLKPIEFTACGSNVHFTVHISNICSGASLKKI